MQLRTALQLTIKMVIYPFGISHLKKTTTNNNKPLYVCSCIGIIVCCNTASVYSYIINGMAQHFHHHLSSHFNFIWDIF